MMDEKVLAEIKIKKSQVQGKEKRDSGTGH
jgi:hypothetical protein